MHLSLPRVSLPDQLFPCKKGSISRSQHPCKAGRRPGRNTRDRRQGLADVNHLLSHTTSEWLGQQLVGRAGGETSHLEIAQHWQLKIFFPPSPLNKNPEEKIRSCFSFLLAVFFLSLLLFSSLNLLSFLLFSSPSYPLLSPPLLPSSSFSSPPLSSPLHQFPPRRLSNLLTSILLTADGINHKRTLIENMRSENTGCHPMMHPDSMCSWRHHKPLDHPPAGQRHSHAEKKGPNFA